MLPVRGMACGGCERRVAEAALALPGVTAAAADLVAEELDVTFDPALVDLARIGAAVAAAGFTVDQGSTATPPQRTSTPGLP